MARRGRRHSPSGMKRPDLMVHAYRESSAKENRRDSRRHARRSPRPRRPRRFDRDDRAGRTDRGCRPARRGGRQGRQVPGDAARQGRGQGRHGRARQGGRHLHQRRLHPHQDPHLLRICAKCYGWNLSNHTRAKIGLPAGVLAAQSIGEPGTQLTMRVKHSGGIVGMDVTQDLPRVIELLELRKPKIQAILAEISGKVKVSKQQDKNVVKITEVGEGAKSREVEIPDNLALIVKTGDLISAGQPLTAGATNMQELLYLQGLLVTQQLIIDEVQAVYESQGIPIHDKHFEIIARKMSDKLQIENPGDTEFLTGEVVEHSAFLSKNEAVIAAGGTPATAKILLLGITRSSLFTSSWLSAASFQHTKNVLTDAAISGHVDHLEGLKENVIIGRLIPTDPSRAAVNN